MHELLDLRCKESIFALCRTDVELETLLALPALDV